MTKKKILIITPQWRCFDNRVTNVVNQYFTMLKKNEDTEPEVIHLVMKFSFLENILRIILHPFLELYNGVLPPWVNKPCSTNHINYIKTKKGFSNLAVKLNLRVNEIKPDKIIMHWMDPSINIINQLELNEIEKTLVVHEIDPLLILNRYNIKIAIFENFDNILVRNYKQKEILKMLNIKSEILRSAI